MRTRGQIFGNLHGQAALALERARAQDGREQLVVLEDRERIARDLHDVVPELLAVLREALSNAAGTRRPLPYGCRCAPPTARW